MLEVGESKNLKVIKTKEGTCKGIFQSSGTNLQGRQISLRNEQRDTKNCNNIRKGIKTWTIKKLAAPAKMAEIYHNLKTEKATESDISTLVKRLDKVTHF
jgi:hypothetical protein